MSAAWVALTDDDRIAVMEAMPDSLEGFMKTWGWLTYAKAIEAACREKNAINNDALVAALRGLMRADTESSGDEVQDDAVWRAAMDNARAALAAAEAA